MAKTDADDVVAGSAPASAARPGRPRRYDEAEELGRLLDAGFEVIRRKGYQAVTVADILDEAGLSTRSFYRHFAAKDDLLDALFRRDSVRFAAAVTQRVEAAPDASTALVVWIDEILGFGFGRRRAKRAAVLGSPDAMHSLAPEATTRALQLLIVPLEKVLHEGAADGSFPHVAPASDAPLISAMAWATSNRVGATRRTANKDELRTGLLSFVHRGLGAPTAS